MRRREKSLDFENGKGPSLQQSKHNNQLFAITSSPYYQKHNLFIRELHNHLQNNREKTLMSKHSSERKQFFSRKALNICFFDLNEYFMFFCCWQVTCLHCKTSSQLKKSMWLESWFDLSLYISTRQIRKIMILPSMLTMRLSNTVRFVL